MWTALMSGLSWSWLTSDLFHGLDQKKKKSCWELSITVQRRTELDRVVPWAVMSGLGGGRKELQESCSQWGSLFWAAEHLYNWLFASLIWDPTPTSAACTSLAAWCSSSPCFNNDGGRLSPAMLGLGSAAATHSSVLPFLCETLAGAGQRRSCPSSGWGLCTGCWGGAHGVRCVATPLSLGGRAVLSQPAHCHDRAERHWTLEILLSLQSHKEQWLYLPARQIELTLGLSQIWDFWTWSRKLSWSSAGTSLDEGQTFTLFIQVLGWLARLSGWRS